MGPYHLWVLWDPTTEGFYGTLPLKGPGNTARADSTDDFFRLGHVLLLIVLCGDPCQR